VSHAKTASNGSKTESDCEAVIMNKGDTADWWNI